jgi:hypothetical protein
MIRVNAVIVVFLFTAIIGCSAKFVEKIRRSKRQAELNKPKIGSLPQFPLSRIAQVLA